MTNKKKIAILLPDGVGLRNFVYTDLPKSDSRSYYLWTTLPIELVDSPSTTLPIVNDPKFLSILQATRAHIESFIYYKKYNDKAYLLYGKKDNCYKYNSTKAVITSIMKIIGKAFLCSNWGWNCLTNIIYAYVRKSKRYSLCKMQLEKDAPDFVFNTTQRLTSTIAPMLAAQDLNIPTGTFIYSWDNLPKGGGLVCPANNVFVWSDYMKEEMAKYYPSFPNDNVYVTGTPQFISYFDKHRLTKREEFCSQYGLDPLKKFICFSGDDYTTSPYDQYYLRDLAEVVRKKENHHIILRKCPVDNSDRYNDVVDNYKDVITEINPLWDSIGEGWQAKMATNEDLSLLVNTVTHCEAVINVGSTMAFDFAIYNKPAIYINYNTQECDTSVWDIKNIYKYIHFRTMDSLDPVYWINSIGEIEPVLKSAFNRPKEKVLQAKLWAERIAKHPLQDANKRLWEQIDKILK